jgi:hypothetical protein
MGPVQALQAQGERCGGASTASARASAGARSGEPAQACSRSQEQRASTGLLTTPRAADAGRLVSVVSSYFYHLGVAIGERRLPTFTIWEWWSRNTRLPTFTIWEWRSRNLGVVSSYFYHL